MKAIEKEIIELKAALEEKQRTIQMLRDMLVDISVKSPKAGTPLFPTYEGHIDTTPLGPITIGGGTTTSGPITNTHWTYSPGRTACFGNATFDKLAYFVNTDDDISATI